MTTKQYEQAMADIAMLENANQIPASLAEEQRNAVQEKYDKAQQNKPAPTKKQEEKPAKAAEPTPFAYINDSDYDECHEKMKAKAAERRVNKIAQLKADALKQPNLSREKRAEIEAYNSVQDFTQGNKVDKSINALKSVLDYQERQRVLSLSKNNDSDKEKKILYQKNREKLDNTQTKAAKKMEKALEAFVTELHRRFEAGEDIEALDFEVDIIISKQ